MLIFQGVKHPHHRISASFINPACLSGSDWKAQRLKYLQGERSPHHRVAVRAPKKRCCWSWLPLIIGGIGDIYIYIITQLAYVSLLSWDGKFHYMDGRFLYMWLICMFFSPHRSQKIDVAMKMSPTFPLWIHGKMVHWCIYPYRWLICIW